MVYAWLSCMVIACFYCLRLEANIAEVGEDIEVVDQEYQVQETFEQGKLPSILQLCYYFQIHLLHNGFGKTIKTFSLCVWKDILPPYIISYK